MNYGLKLLMGLQAYEFWAANINGSTNFYALWAANIDGPANL